MGKIQRVDFLSYFGVKFFVYPPVAYAVCIG